MPEGDTIHRAAQVLHLALSGKVVVGFETAYAQLAEVDRTAPIVGRTVEGVEARGKHLLVRLSGDLALRTHMRMNGTWHLYRAGERWRKPRAAMRVAISTADFTAVAFDVPIAEFLSGAQLRRHVQLTALGPDLLAGQFDAAEAGRRLRARGGAAIADALLDQRAIAGIGNVFKSEILFATGVHPERAVASLSDDELTAILTEARRQLRVNAPPDGRPRTAGHRRWTTGSLDPARSLWVYGRAGEPCRRCGAPVALLRQGLGARLTYYCPRCQPPDPAAVGA